MSSFAVGYSMKKKAKKCAEGGEVFHDEEEASGDAPKPKASVAHNHAAEVEDEDMVGRILKKRQFAKGGVVANSTVETADEQSAEFDDLVLDDELEPHFPEGGNEHGGPAEDHEGEDMVKRILKKQHNPRPA